MVIEVKNIEKEFKTHKRGEGLAEAIKSLYKRKHVYKKALKGISFDIKKGEIVGFVGPNGAGKSTAIKILSGILHPDSGEAKILGYVPWKQREEYVANIGVVFGQKSQLWWDLPAIDSYELLRHLYNVPISAYKRRLSKLLKLLDIQDVAKTPVRNLSLGERMKCELVAALLHNPKIVFLDEPTIGVDIVSKDRIRDFVRETNKEYGTTFIVTTHDMNDIELLCDRIIVINEGEIIYDGLLADIKRAFYIKKVIDVKFTESPRGFKYPKGCSRISRGKYEIKLEVNLKKNTVNKVVQYVLNDFSVADITISDPSVEEVIKDIYQHGIAKV